MSQANCQDCKEEKEFNPKSHQQQQRRRIQVVESESPVQAQIRDRSEVQSFFKEYKRVFVPYSGTEAGSSHALMAFLLSLSDISPTQSAILESMRKALFGGDIEIIGRVDPVFNLGSSEISNTERETFHSFLMNEMSFHGLSGITIDLRKFGELAWSFVKKVGFCFAEIVHTKVLEQVHTKVHIHHPLNTLFFFTKRNEPRVVAVSPVWTSSYIAKYAPDAIPLYPNFITEKNQSRSMIMFGSGTNTWYPFPSNISTMLHRYSEFQQVDYVVKQTHSKFMGEVFLEVEADEFKGSDTEKQSDPVEELSDLLNQDHTNQGSRPSSIIVSARPQGARQAFVFQFNPNLQPNWYKTMAEVNRGVIIAGEGWSKKMLGFTESSGISSNGLTDEFKVKNVTVIKPEQTAISNVINEIIYNSANVRSLHEIKKVSINYSSPYKTMLDESNNSDPSSSE